ncbi:MAG: SURF1 family protein [Gammaproteobacteria bacterium]
MKFETIPTAVFLCVFPLLLALGFWQLDRAQEKRAYLDLLAGNKAAETITLTGAAAGSLVSLRYRPAKAAGHYDAEHQFLIDNQIKDGRPGYLVLTPFKLKNGEKAVLVNRGWVPLTGDRSELPDIRIKENQSMVKGRINSFPSVGIKLPGADKPTAGWPSIVQVVDTAILVKELGYPLFDFMIELDKDLPEGYKREWRELVILPPEQHVAYAVQWFGLALTLALLFIWYSRLK